MSGAGVTHIQLTAFVAPSSITVAPKQHQASRDLTRALACVHPPAPQWVVRHFASLILHGRVCDGACQPDADCPFLPIGEIPVDDSFKHASRI